jgi:hypothetical protein
VTRITFLLLALILTSVIAWGSTVANSHELPGGDLYFHSCIGWSHAAENHPRELFDRVDYAAHRASEDIGRELELPGDVVITIELCATNPENLDRFIERVSDRCSGIPEDMSAGGLREGLYLAMSPVTADLLEFCTESAISEHGFGSESYRDIGI